MTTLLLALGVFGTCFLLFSVGLLVKGMMLRSSCGGAARIVGGECGGCKKKEKELCPSDDDTGLLHIAQVSNPQRTLKEPHYATPRLEV